MPITRRDFIGKAALGAAGGIALQKASHAAQTALPPDQSHRHDGRPLFVSTWPFGKDVNDKALSTFQAGGSLLDSVEQGIHVAEADITNASVGIGGIPNAEGVVQLDACIMDGPGHRAGSVAAIENILHPISVARRVMDDTKHVMLAGDGARRFALSQGFEEVDLLSDAQRANWEKWKARQQAAKKDENPGNHDTITLLGLGPDGHLAGGCSTSGWGFKLPGRVGDSPIIGGGLYVDDEVGAAGSTGLGENIMRYCATFMIVEYMRQGLDPQSACIETIHRMARTDPLGMDLSAFFIAVDKQGRFGAAGTGQGFEYAVTIDGDSRLYKSAALGDKVVPLGGNR